MATHDSRTEIVDSTSGLNPATTDLTTYYSGIINNVFRDAINTVDVNTRKLTNKMSFTTVDFGASRLAVGGVSIRKPDGSIGFIEMPIDEFNREYADNAPNKRETYTGPVSRGARFLGTEQVSNAQILKRVPNLQKEVAQRIEDNVKSKEFQQIVRTFGNAVYVDAEGNVSDTPTHLIRCGKVGNEHSYNRASRLIKLALGQDDVENPLIGRDRVIAGLSVGTGERSSTIIEKGHVGSSSVQLAIAANVRKAVVEALAAEARAGNVQIRSANLQVISTELRRQAFFIDQHFSRQLSEDATFEFWDLRDGFGANQTVTLQTKDFNNVDAHALQTVGPQLREFYEQRQEEIVAAIVAGLVRAFQQDAEGRVFRVGGSPAPAEYIANRLVDTFLERKTKNVKKKKTIKAKRIAVKKKKRNVKGKIALPSVSVKVKRKHKAPEQVATDLNTMLPILNEKFHDAIRADMGKGGAKEKLNYRTGRFARSAEILSLYPSKSGKTAEARVRYMRNPYGVFEKGGQLYKTLRDPAGIFGRSIRRMLQEEKLAQFSRIKVDLNG